MLGRASVQAVIIDLPKPIRNWDEVCRIARESLDYDAQTGSLKWKTRPIHHFPDKRAHAIWNTKLAGKEAGTPHNGGYVSVALHGRRYLKHRLVWLIATGDWPINQIDYVNGVKTDNRFCNLREATNAENNRNNPKRSNNTSGLKGVSWHMASNKWRANIAANGKRRQIGVFDCRAAAFLAYVIEADKLHGTFARTR